MTEIVYKLTAEEDIRYRMMSSYPPEGFFLRAGQAINIVKSALPHLKVRKNNGKGKGNYTLTLYKERTEQAAA